MKISAVNVTYLLIGIFFSLAVSEQAFSQRGSSNTATSRRTRNTTTTPAQTQAQQPQQQAPVSIQVQQNQTPGEPFYDFSKLSSADNFRNIPWGASKEQVLSSDSSPRKETGEDYLILEGKLSNIRVDISYFFWKGYFIKGAYITNEHFNDFSGYMEKYQILKEKLEKKFGSPLLDMIIWNDFEFKSKPERWLLALSRSHLEYSAYWQKDKIIISLKMESINNRPAIKIEYFIDKFDAEIQQVDDSDILRDL